jgi:hypothetical protein
MPSTRVRLTYPLPFIHTQLPFFYSQARGRLPGLLGCKTRSPLGVRCQSHADVTRPNLARSGPNGNHKFEEEAKILGISRLVQLHFRTWDTTGRAVNQSDTGKTPSQ